MMAREHGAHPKVADPNYMLLLDARRRETYDESHIQLAKFTSKTSNGEYQLPYDAGIETVQHVVVYDNRTEVLKVDGVHVKTEATVLAKMLYNAGARHPIKVLRGTRCVQYLPFRGFASKALHSYLAAVS
ncbi:STYXL1 [Bugula neritina]|uniref:STYXL1 n=1 Tax=Bugula neritina TaxID=10212 RepID=A0A7J7KMF9_BUGNE|nr:STYXL1 [Bugula neritina]